MTLFKVLVNNHEAENSLTAMRTWSTGKLTSRKHFVSTGRVIKVTIVCEDLVYNTQEGVPKNSV
jgi:hypothetical protein